MIQEIGKHKVRCGDVMDDLSELYKDVKVDIMYTDPPWMNLNYWQTLNNKDTGALKKNIDNEQFINRLFEVACLYLKEDGILFMEFGKKWNEQIVQRARWYGFNNAKSIELLYGSPARPCMLNIFTRSMLIFPEEYESHVWHTKGYETLKQAVTPFAKEGNVITDPCCGCGYTAQIAVDTGMVFYGNELNQKRLDKTIKRLSNG